MQRIYYFRRAGLATLIAVLIILVYSDTFVYASNIVNGKFDLMNSAEVHAPMRSLGVKRSDVVFSTRWPRDNAHNVIKSFGASRVEWMYIRKKDDTNYIKLLKNSVDLVGGTLNANVATPNDSGVAKDFDGNPIVAPWMKTWGAKWVTTTNPLTRKALFDWASFYIEAGADSIQFDDPLLQVHTIDWGGDFSDTSISGFREYLQNYPDKKELATLGIKDLHKFDYKEYLHTVHGIRNKKDYLRRFNSLATTPLWKQYQVETVGTFFKELRKHLDNKAGRRFPFSMNLLIGRPDETKKQFFLTEFADYVIAETRLLNDTELYTRTATFRAMGIGYVPSTAPRSVLEGRMAISTLYALGATPLVPWDVFKMGPDRKPMRYFGTIEEYGDLYHFVRENSSLFDHWESTPVVGIIIPVDKYREDITMSLVHRLVSNQVPFAFVFAGGNLLKFKIDEKRLKYFGALTVTNPLEDFSQNDRAILQSINLSNLDAKELDNLSPFFSTEGSDGLKLIPRSQEAQANRDELVIHVIADNAGESSCTRSIGIKSSILAGKHPKKIMWYSVNDTPKRAKWSKVTQGFKIELPSCSTWGIAHIKLTK